MLGQHVGGYNFTRLLEEMMEYGVPPNALTFELLLEAYEREKVWYSIKLLRSIVAPRLSSPAPLNKNALGRGVCSSPRTPRFKFLGVLGAGENPAPIKSQNHH
jgi:hypothetical protein